jgi:hypothetical protein
MSNLENRSSKVVKLGAIALAGLAVGIGSLLTTASSASAQAAYGSYIGIGASVGVTDGPNGEGGGNAGGLIAVRYKFLELPISARVQVLISDSSAVVPTVSYDIPLDWQTDFYVGVGAAIQDSNNTSSPIGNQTSFVLQPGIDYSFPDSNMVLFGNAIIAFDAYKQGGGTAASLQGGVGVRF